jgi:hypothetical protein
MDFSKEVTKRENDHEDGHSLIFSDSIESYWFTLYTVNSSILTVVPVVSLISHRVIST